MLSYTSTIDSNLEAMLVALSAISFQKTHEFLISLSPEKHNLKTTKQNAPEPSLQSNNTQQLITKVHIPPKTSLTPSIPNLSFVTAVWQTAVTDQSLTSPLSLVLRLCIQV